MARTGSVDESRHLILETADSIYHTEDFPTRGVIGISLSVEVPKHKLDVEYPHVCFKCKKPLKFKEMMLSNINMHKDYLENLWKSKSVEFYCCGCYSREIYGKTIAERINEYMRESGRRWRVGLRGLEADEIWVDEVESLEFGYDNFEE